MQSNERIIADIATLQQQHINLERLVVDKISIATGEIKEHINKVGEMQRKDTQSNRDYCEAENNNIYKGMAVTNAAIGETNARINKFKWTVVGGLTVVSGVIGIAAWAINVLAK